jgi:hypothetical protein
MGLIDRVHQFFLLRLHQDVNSLILGRHGFDQIVDASQINSPDEQKDAQGVSVHIHFIIKKYWQKNMSLSAPY